MTDLTVELIEKVDDLANELREVHAVLERKLRTARRSIRLSVIALAAVVLLFGLKWRDDHVRAVAACESSNRARESSQARIEDAGNTLTDSFARVIAASNPTATPEADARRDDLFAQVKDDYVQHMRANWSVDLQPRDC